MTTKKTPASAKTTKKLSKPKVSDGYVVYALNEDVPMELTDTLAEAHVTARELLDDWDDEVSIAEISILGTYCRPEQTYNWKAKTKDK